MKIFRMINSIYGLLNKREKNGSKRKEKAHPRRGSLRKNGNDLSNN
jgi:hypothetical protein